jgi:Lar family restriction alleviation protein
MADLEQGLKPCPFCGTKDNGDGKIRMRIDESSEGYFSAVCWCGGAGPIMESEREALEAWNARGPGDRQQIQYPFDSSKCTNPVGFRGNLKSVALPTILQILSTDNRTGVLHFEQGQAIRAICLKDGRIVAASGREGHRLGQILYDRGLISQEQLEEALEKTKEEKKRLGEVLLDLGYINEESLKKLIRYQIQEAVLDISLWAEGDFEYRDCQMEFDERGVEVISTMGIVLEAAARKDEWAAA